MPDRNSTILGKALAVWIVLIVAEIVHGIARAILLAPRVGEFRSHQIGVFTGSIIILAVTWLAVGWIGASRTSQLLGIGLLWLCLTLAFELLFGHFVVGASWQRLAADYKLWEGGLLPLGMAVLVLAPLIAAKLRGQPAATRSDEFQSPEDLNAFLTAVGAKLRDRGHAEAADTLMDIQQTAFTTGSEWLGELGLRVRRLQRDATLDADIRRDLKRIMRAVNRVWPRL